MIAFAEAEVADSKRRAKTEPALVYIWNWFLDLHSSRFYTTGALGIGYLEIEAFERGNLLTLTVFERLLLRRIDRAVIAILNSRSPKTGAKNSVDPNDTHAIESMFSDLAR